VGEEVIECGGGDDDDDDDAGGGVDVRSKSNYQKPQVN
jgi:hypothetical protein